MSPTPQGSPFDLAIDRYLQRQRVLGRGYVHEERVIDALHRFLKKNGCVDLDQAVFEAWCASQGHLAANTRRSRQRIVRNFCLYRQRAEPTASSRTLTAFRAAVRMRRRSSSGRLVRHFCIRALYILLHKMQRAADLF